MFAIIKPIQQYILPTIGISLLTVCGVNPEKTITSIVFKVVKFFNVDKSMNDLNFINSPYIQFILIASAIVWLFTRIEKHVNKKTSTQQKIHSIQDKASNTILTAEDVKMLSYCYYDDKTKQFYFCKSRELYSKYYMEQEYYYESNHSVKFDKYQQVSIDFLPRKAKSIKIRLWNVCDKRYDDDPYINTMQYPCQHTIYLKFNDKEIKINEFSEYKDGVIELQHADVDNALFQNMYTNANFYKYFEFRLEITNETNKKEEELIAERQKLSQFQKIDVNTKRLKIDILSFTI